MFKKNNKILPKREAALILPLLLIVPLPDVIPAKVVLAPIVEPFDRLCKLALLLSPFILDTLPPKELLGEGLRLNVVFPATECSNAEDIIRKRSSFLSIFLDILFK